MIISHSRKFIFIKSRKTAGTSLEAALSRCCSGDDIVTPLGDYRHNRDDAGRFVHHALNSAGFEQHDDAISIRDKISPAAWSTYYKFSITRNPWDKVISEFFWEKRRDPSLKPAKRFYHYLGVPFDELGQLKPLFSEFVKSYRNTNDRFYLIDGKLCVDFVIRYENLADDFAAVCERIGIDMPELPRLKSGIRNGSRHYSAYYDDESASIVAARHRNDIELFGYRFERS